MKQQYDLEGALLPSSKKSSPCCGKTILALLLVIFVIGSALVLSEFHRYYEYNEQFSANDKEDTVTDKISEHIPQNLKFCLFRFDRDGLSVNFTTEDDVTRYVTKNSSDVAKGNAVVFLLKTVWLMSPEVRQLFSLILQNDEYDDLWQNHPELEVMFILEFGYGQWTFVVYNYPTKEPKSDSIEGLVVENVVNSMDDTYEFAFGMRSALPIGAADPTELGDLRSNLFTDNKSLDVRDTINQILNQFRVVMELTNVELVEIEDVAQPEETNTDVISEESTEEIMFSIGNENQFNILFDDEGLRFGLKTIFEESSQTSSKSNESKLK